MINIVAVEDEKKEQERLRECLSYTSKNKGIPISTEFFCDATSFLNGFHRGKYDLLLLDIELPDKNGIDLAHEIRKQDEEVSIVFVTNMVNFALKGYEVSARDYVVKPISEASFNLRIGRILTSLEKSDESKVELVIEDNRKRYVSLKDIYYLDVDGHYVTWHTVEGNYREYTTMKMAISRIDSPLFVRCNRCYLVNLPYVKGIDEDDTCLVNEDHLLISRGEKKNFIAKLALYLSGGIQ